MAAVSLCQPVASVGSGRQGLVVRVRDVGSWSSQPASAMVSSVAFRKSEAERLCAEAGRRTDGDALVSQFWSKGSRKGLAVKRAPVAVFRPGSHLVVVRGSHTCAALFPFDRIPCVSALS